MREENRFQVARHAARCELNSGDKILYGWLENISLSGAMISLDDSPQTPLAYGEQFTMTVHATGVESPFEFLVRLSHHAFTIVGLNFLSRNETMIVKLCLLIGLVTMEMESADCWEPMEVTHDGRERLRVVNS